MLTLYLNPAQIVFLSSQIKADGKIGNIPVILRKPIRKTPV